MKPSGIITLLTDFGDRDGFVGTMKGVMLSINPAAKIIDLSHQVPDQDIAAGAFILGHSYSYFPHGTVHVAVVDPGVGSTRKILAVQTQHYFFVAPDNEILNYIFHSGETLTVIEVLNKQFFLEQVSQTFHGRDIFAPVAAHLSAGVPISRLGPETQTFRRGEIKQPVVADSHLTGEIIYIDKFGNLITNIPAGMLKRPIAIIQTGSLVLNQLSGAYSEVAIGQPVALIGSAGYLEIAIRHGNASQQFARNRGDQITVKFKSAS